MKDTSQILSDVAPCSNDSHVVEATTTISKGDQLGSGGFAHVFRAVQNDTKRIVAVKQSRVSLLVKRPPLQHEAKVLKLLSGHPNIPEIYAYGHVAHFEVISMQLLHRSLKDAVLEDGQMSVKAVANIADQMMDALQHVHSHGLVHRDIKPTNIMLQRPGSWAICLIDFGLARRPPSSVSSTRPALPDSNLAPDKSAYVTGTLQFASVNAHEKDPQLTFRDDIESLAYTLVWLLRGELPWSYYTKGYNTAPWIRQVHAQKKRHTGSTIATKLPAEFGELIDYARSMLPANRPSYNEWQRRFQNVEEFAVEQNAQVVQAPQASPARPEPPVEVGQIVLIKPDPFVTGDGYTIREGHESSFIPDSFYDRPEWSTMARPALVSQVEWDKVAKQYSFLAIALSRSSDHDGLAVPIATTGSDASDGSLVVHTKPEWPLGGSFFCAYKRPTRFHCLPTQPRLHSTWQVANSDCESLLNALTPPPDTASRSQEEQDFKSPDPDIRHDARMRKWAGYCRLYAQIQPLTSAQLDDDSIDWFSKRDWFDECVKIQRHKNLHGGCWWTGAWFSPRYRRKEGELPDSYFGSDFYIWPQCHTDRDCSITLAASGEDARIEGDILVGLTKIVGLEKESQAENA